MPRGRKPKNVSSIQEQINDIDAQIEDYKQKIVESKEKKKQLLQCKEKEEMTALYNAVKASGKTPEELLKSLGETKE